MCVCCKLTMLFTLESLTTTASSVHLRCCVLQSPVLDVWLQLLEKCLSTSNCHPAVITTLRNQASTFFGRTLALQQQVNGLQQQVWQSAMRAHMHEQQIMQHQCLAAQQQQQLMTQQQQIVELQAQVQQLLQRLPPQM